MSASHSADELLYQIEAEKLGHEVKPKVELVPDVEPEPEPEVGEPEPEAESLDAPEEPEPQAVSQKQDAKEKPSAKAEQDEYGNDLPKAKTYTEEEVQRMIRDRLSRGQHAQQQVQPVQQQQTADQGFTPDPNSADNWEVQLEQFIDKRIDSREQVQSTRAQQQREAKIQAEFQDKFTSGMTRYGDFQDVVGSKPITDAMMLGTRGFNDPAAFMYSAAKHHGKELERIAGLSDPYQQSAEIGRLEATMRKARATTSASKPLAQTKGDMGGKSEEIRMSTDDKIRQDAKRKFRR